jgi:hypothetical protein
MTASPSDSIAKIESEVPVPGPLIIPPLAYPLGFGIDVEAAAPVPLKAPWAITACLYASVRFLTAPASAEKTWIRLL